MYEEKSLQRWSHCLNEEFGKSDVMVEGKGRGFGIAVADSQIMLNNSEDKKDHRLHEG